MMMLVRGVAENTDYILYYMSQYKNHPQPWSMGQLFSMKLASGANMVGTAVLADPCFRTFRVCFDETKVQGVSVAEGLIGLFPASSQPGASAGTQFRRQLLRLGKQNPG